jgi:hypothetical protein
MGLDAVVFKGRTTIEREHPGRDFEVEPDSFDWNLVDDSSNLSLFERTSCDHRIGNLDGVCKLRESVRRVLPEESVTLSVVLFCAFGGGHSVPPLALGQLAGEIETLASSSDASVLEFVAAMRELLVAAEREQTTIVLI